MKLAVTMISFEDYAGSGKMTVYEFIDICRDYCLDAVDILEYFWGDKEKEIKEIPGLLKNRGLEIGAFCVGNNFLVEKEERSRQVEYVKAGIETAARLRAPRLRIFGGSRSLPESIRLEDRADIIIQSIRECLQCAADNNIILVLENHGGFPVTSQEMLQVLKGVNSPYLKINFDIGNFLGTGGQDPMEAANDLFEYVDHIHVKDLVEVNGANGKYASCITGEGIVPVKECLDFFRQKGYEGYVSLEYEAWDRCESKAGVKASVEFLKKIMK